MIIYFIYILNMDAGNLQFLLNIDLYQELLPRAYLLKFFEQNIRPDGRQFSQERQAEIAITPDYRATY